MVKARRASPAIALVVPEHDLVQCQNSKSLNASPNVLQEFHRTPVEIPFFRVN